MRRPERKAAVKPDGVETTVLVCCGGSKSDSAERENWRSSSSSLVLAEARSYSEVVEMKPQKAIQPEMKAIEEGETVYLMSFSNGYKREIQSQMSIL